MIGRIVFVGNIGIHNWSEAFVLRFSLQFVHFYCLYFLKKSSHFLNWNGKRLILSPFFFSPLRGSAASKTSDKRSSSTKEDKSHVSAVWHMSSKCRRCECLPFSSSVKNIFWNFLFLAGEPAKTDLPIRGATPQRNATKRWAGTEMQVWIKTLLLHNMHLLTWFKWKHMKCCDFIPAECSCLKESHKRLFLVKLLDLWRKIAQGLSYSLGVDWSLPAWWNLTLWL